MEHWKDIKGYEGLYQVSDLGRIKSLERTFRSGKNHLNVMTYPSRVIKNKRYKSGYLYIVLSKNGVPKKFKIHRLVAQAFCPNPDGKPCVDHINTKRDDNRAENLRWVDNITNQNNPISIRLRSRNKMGDLNPMKKRQKPIVQIDPATGRVIGEFSGAKAAARELGLDSGNISRVCNGQREKYRGFVFRFKENQ